MVRIISLDRIEQNARTVFDNLGRGDYFIVKKDGKPIAGILDIGEMEDFIEVNNPAMEKQIKRGYQEFLKGEARPARILLEKIKGVKRGRKVAGRT